MNKILQWAETSSRYFIWKRQSAIDSCCIDVIFQEIQLN